MSVFVCGTCRMVSCLALLAVCRVAGAEQSAAVSIASDEPPATASEHSTDAEGMGYHGYSMIGMSAGLGPYPMTREASGTAWQPDDSVHAGIHAAVDDWMLMTHALINGVYDQQDGPRGGDKSFVSGMAMTAATQMLDEADILRFRAMLSPEPLMGPSGYPLLFATGETADGRTPLIDRQHPHNLVMELSGSVAHLLDGGQSVFLYAGLPGEPAFGPPVFMHRLSIEDSPEAPISHHWLDSTHVTNGVVTMGYVNGNWKIEASRFYGREPDQHHYRIEPGPLDSTAARLSWNPNHSLSLQVSWAHQISPEQLAPQQNETRASASVLHTVPFGDDGYWATTAAYGYRRSTGRPGLPAEILESTIKPDGIWTVFGRFERVDNDELVAVQDFEGPTYTVAKCSLGAIHDWSVLTHIKVGLGALYAFNFVPAALVPLYGHDPAGMMVFVRMKVD
jgi:hypothetical protein